MLNNACTVSKAYYYRNLNVDFTEQHINQTKFDIAFFLNDRGGLVT
jgi:hypothetical protein